MRLRVRTYRTDAWSPRVAPAPLAVPYRAMPALAEPEEAERHPDRAGERLRSEG